MVTDTAETVDTRPPLTAVFLLSATALAYEVLLVRQFSVIHWHHFAFMVISIALLGYGVSGSLITLMRKTLLAHYPAVMLGNILLFAIAMTACYAISLRIPFNALEILWDFSQWQRLLLSYCLLALPFLFAANAIALTLMRYHDRIALTYSIDLLGAGAGALAIMLLLSSMTAETTIRLLSWLGLLAGILTWSRLERAQRIPGLLAIACCAVMLVLTPPDWLLTRMSDYKGLQQMLQVSGTQHESTSSSPVSRIDVVATPDIPLRYAPGLSLNSPAAPPVQHAVFIDGDTMTAIDHYDDDTDLAYYGAMTSALPYRMRPGAGNVLVLDAATGAGVLQAHHHGAQRIDAVNADAQLWQLLQQNYADEFGWERLNHKLHAHTISPRGFAARGGEFDLVVMGPGGASAGSAAGVHAFSASYELTAEALAAYMKLLDDDALLAITLWTANPPRGNLKLFATVVDVLRDHGVQNPGQHIAWLRGWNTATLVVKRSALNAGEIARAREFSEAFGFDLAWLPGMQPSEANRYTLLQEPVFHAAALALTGDDADGFIDRYKYNIRPVSDDAPWFDDDFRLGTFMEMLRMPGRSGLSLVSTGYPTLVVTLLQAVVVALLLILAPLLVIRRSSSGRDSMSGFTVRYFLAIGLGFLFIEIAFIQHFTLVLSQPLYAVAVALSAFLVFSGFGSLLVQRKLVRDKDAIPRQLRRSVILVSLFATGYAFGLHELGQLLMPLPEWSRILSAFVVAAPLAFVMGMPFPLGLALLQAREPAQIPWAWGINGCASVLSAILAMLVAMAIGFSGLMLCAALLYLLAAAGKR